MTRQVRISFSATNAFISNPTNNWMKEWDVATFVESLEEAYPLAPGDRHLGRGQRWLEVVYRLQRIQVRNDDMAALRNSVIAEAEDAEMDDSDNDSHPGVRKARREIDSLKERLRQSEQETRNMADRLDERIKESKRLESESNKLKSKNTKLEEKVKQSQDEVSRTKSSYDKVSSQLDISQNSENVKGTQITNLTEKIKSLQAQVAKHEKSIIEYQTGESDFQAEIIDLEERLSEAETQVSEIKERREGLQLQYNKFRYFWRRFWVIFSPKFLFCG